MGLTSSASISSPIQTSAQTREPQISCTEPSKTCSSPDIFRGPRYILRNPNNQSQPSAGLALDSQSPEELRHSGCQPRSAEFGPRGAGCCKVAQIGAHLPWTAPRSGTHGSETLTWSEPQAGATGASGFLPSRTRSARAAPLLWQGSPVPSHPIAPSPASSPPPQAPAVPALPRSESRARQKRAECAPAAARRDGELQPQERPPARPPAACSPCSPSCLPALPPALPGPCSSPLRSPHLRRFDSPGRERRNPQSSVKQRGTAERRTPCGFRERD